MQFSPKNQKRLAIDNKLGSTAALFQMRESCM